MPRLAPGVSLDLPGLAFDAGRHAYTFEGRPLPSVSSVLEAFKRPFDALHHSARKARQRGVPQSVVLREWETKRDASTDLGHGVHDIAEAAVWDRSTLPADDALPQVRALAEFLASRPGLEPLATEVQIAWPEGDIAGTLDLLARQDGRVFLCDWKTNAAIESTSTFRDAWMLPPVAHLSDCNGVHYELQLSLYQVILWEQYGLRVDGRVLIHLRHDGTFAVLRPRFLEAEVHEILAAYPARAEAVRRAKREQRQAIERILAADAA
jgi:hypothetical protein